MVVGGFWQQVPQEHVPKTSFLRLVCLGEKLSFRMVCADVAKRPAEGFLYYNVRPITLHGAGVPGQHPKLVFTMWLALCVPGMACEAALEVPCTHAHALFKHVRTSSVVQAIAEAGSAVAAKACSSLSVSCR